VPRPRRITDQATRPAELCVVLALALAACAGAGQLNAPGSQPTPPTMNLPHLARLFEDGATFAAETLTVTVRTHDIGLLHLADGRVVVADAFAAADTAPLAQRVPPGRYSVVLSIAAYSNSPYEAIAAAMVRLADGEPSTWRAAPVDGQDPGTLGPDEFFGYPVDSGTAMLASPTGARLFGESNVRFGVLNVDRIKALSEQMAANAPDGGGWLNLTLDEKDGTNAVLVESGFGDGAYGVFWGYDASGALVCLVTEFGLVDLE
jgi:hypothetical protein